MDRSLPPPATRRKAHRFTERADGARLDLEKSRSGCNLQAHTRLLHLVIRRVRDREAEFQEFFIEESEKLRRFALWLTGNPDRAHDLAQEALARTFRYWGRIRDIDAGPYARRILVNLVRNAHRRNVLEFRHQSAAEGVVDAETNRVDEWLRIADALKTLTPIRRATVLLRFYEDRSEAEISEILDRPLGTVKSDLHRALAKLRNVLKDNTREPA